MPAHVIASPELLSPVLVSKYADHLPLYRQRQIFRQVVLHADEIPITIMHMGEDEKKPEKGYVEAYVPRHSTIQFMR